MICTKIIYVYPSILSFKPDKGQLGFAILYYIKQTINKKVKKKNNILSY